MRQFAPTLEVIGLAPCHVRLDRLPANEEEVDRAIFFLSTELSAKAARGRVQQWQRLKRGRLERLFATGRDRHDDVLEHHARAINRARSFSSLATPIAVCANAIAPARTARSASGVMQAAVNSG